MTSLRDALFAFAFGDETKANDLLRHLIPSKLARSLDCSALRRLTAPLPPHPVRRAPADVLFSCRLRTGRPLLVYCALQHSSRTARCNVTDMLGCVASALQDGDFAALAEPREPHVLPLQIYVGKRPHALPIPLTELFDDAWMPDTPSRFALLLDDVLRANYHALAGRTLSFAELHCLGSMASWRVLAKFPEQLRYCLEVWRELLDEMTTVNATTPAAATCAAVRSRRR